MAARLLNAEVSELCLGKPELGWIPASAALSDALAALKRSRDSHVSVWACGGDSTIGNGSCVCVGKICAADVILYLCKEENLGDPFKAFRTPVSEILPRGFPIVRHLESNSSLLKAIDYILEGTQNLVIRTQNHRTTNPQKTSVKQQQAFVCTRHNGDKYCWLTQEDVIRFLLNSIGAFSPIPTYTIKSLNVINADIMTVRYNEPAFTVLNHFQRALNEQTSVAVVDEDNRLIGEISPSTLAHCDPTVAAAITVLSAGDLMAYIDCGGPTEDLVQLMKMRLEEKKLGRMVELVDEFFNSSISSSSSSCSSDDDTMSNRNSGLGRQCPARSSEAIICSPNSSLVAVIIQALTHRDSCVWVVEEDYTLVGNVTFAGILKVFRSFAGGRHVKNVE